MEAALDPVMSAQPIPHRSRWTGRILSGVPVAFLAFDAAVKLAHVPAVSEASERIGWPDALNSPLAVILLACVALYLVPRTAALGGVLLTAYLGGAVAIHARIGNSLFSATLLPVYVAMLLWAGLYLRDPRVRGTVAPVR